MPPQGIQYLGEAPSRTERTSLLESSARPRFKKGGGGKKGATEQGQFTFVVQLPGRKKGLEKEIHDLKKESSNEEKEEKMDLKN